MYTLWTTLIDFNVSSGGIATGYGMDDQGSIPGRVSDSSLLHKAHTGYGAHPAPYPVGIQGSFPSGEASDRSLTSISWSRMMKLYLHTFIRLRGVIIN
jgi:hypothetical protein